MLTNFCTLFDSNYLSRGLAMYESLRRHCRDFHLYIFAFDDRCFSVLNKLNLEKTTVIGLKDFLDEALLKIQPSRTATEFCWTATSATVLFAINKYNLDICTYLDADVYFFASPEILLNEIRDNSVILSPHRYSKDYDRSATNGIYCVQFITFKNDERGLRALNWWKDACYEWCYARAEEGKFGDQKYLDSMIKEFSGIHELCHLGGGVAPWNVQRYHIFKKDSVLTGHEIQTGREFDVIFYHFQNLRFLDNERLDLCIYKLRKEVKELIYRPYLKDLEEAKRKIGIMDDTFDPHGRMMMTKLWKMPFRYIKGKARGDYNIYKKKYFLQ